MKYDECHSTPQQELHRFFDMRDALNKTGRPILYSICPVQSRCDGAYPLHTLHGCPVVCCLRPPG